MSAIIDSLSPTTTPSTTVRPITSTPRPTFRPPTSTCPPGKYNLDGLCCIEGSVNNNGKCEDSCPPGKIEEANICKCPNDKVDLDGLCCDEGLVNNNGICEEFKIRTVEGRVTLDKEFTNDMENNDEFRNEVEEGLEGN